MFTSTHANLNEVIPLTKLHHKSQSLTNILVPGMRNLFLSCQTRKYMWPPKLYMWLLLLLVSPQKLKISLSSAISMAGDTILLVQDSEDAVLDLTWIFSSPNIGFYNARKYCSSFQREEATKICSYEPHCLSWHDNLKDAIMVVIS